MRPNPVFNRTPCGSPRLALHFILGQARSAARRRLTLTLGHAVRSPGASPFTSSVAEVARRCQQPWPASPTQASFPSRFIHICPCRAGSKTRRLLEPRPMTAPCIAVQRSATRGKHGGLQGSAGQSVVCASRDSAAPGSQLVVFRAAAGACASGASRGTRTREQPTLRAWGYSAAMASRTSKPHTFRRREARPNPVFNRTPCGSPRMALISFWAKRGLPQGAG
jgi:hypothetical protein